MMAQLKAENFKPVLRQKKLYKIQLGPFETKARTNQVEQRLNEHNFKFYRQVIYLEQPQQL